MCPYTLVNVTVVGCRIVGVRQELVERVCIFGATAAIQGLVARVDSELTPALAKLYPDIVQAGVSVSVTNEEPPSQDSPRPTCSFKGASAHISASRVDETVYLSSSNTITQEEYEDLGSAHIPSSFTG